MVRGTIASDCTFEDILQASEIKMAPRGLYFAKEYRTCEYLAGFCKCVQLAIAVKDKQITRLLEEIAEARVENSQESHRTADLCEEVKDITKEAIRRGLIGVTDVTPAQADELVMTKWRKQG